jgi:hypothetical protein
VKGCASPGNGIDFQITVQLADTLGHAYQSQPSRATWIKAFAIILNR